MAWTNYQILLAVVMVITGSINTLSTKWADSLDSAGKNGEVHDFDHPFFQASCMFIGEMLCLLTFKILYKVYSRRADGSEDVNELTRGNRNFSPFVLFLPAMCDMTATSIMYIGLNLTYASSFQMFRGSVIVFVGLLSVGFLERMLKKREWVGIFFVIVGLAVVGAADFLTKDTNAQNHGRNDIITGDLLIVIAQIITAIQMVVEEKFVAGLDIPPLQAIGWEGLFGFTVLGLLQIPFYYIKAGPPFTNNPHGTLEDAIDALIQIGHSWQLMFAILGTIFSIAFFNFAGISVTKEISATTRMVLDSVRTIIIWIVSLMFMHQKFHWLQLLGFVALLYGMCLYNGITCTFIFIKIRALFMRLRYRNMEEDSIIENRTADLPDDSTPA
ncbi:solute carrier family 35 member F6 [Tribolium madens]|uniref:solute carrier family 35 member F6 n=1 Tax=Tribolium madens TaxID=41895 RepID=UPI001CF73BDE|nr:solute carrier family 35 member F6 [Tribolium madens]